MRSMKQKTVEITVTLLLAYGVVAALVGVGMLAVLVYQLIVY